jgi:hypothetical protein
MRGKTEMIILVGIITMMLASLINVITTPFFQNANAFSLEGTFNKLFGGLFHKSSPKQTQPQQSQQQQQQQQTNTNNASVITSSTRAPSSSTIPTACHIVNGGLPDPKCTPGAINPDVTQDNIKNTICVPGYTKTVRPPVSYTTPLKIKLMKSYGFTDSRSNYEFDHLIPLEVGGHPTDVKNLFPEPGYGQYNFHVKDRFENYLHGEVCNGSIKLSDAQKEIATDWIAYWIKAGRP